jgi:uncharacterized membrane protein YraQ (UPF0718 family)
VGPAGVRQALALLPALAAALLLGALIGVLVPRERVAQALGAASGLRGLALAQAFGMATPGGPFASFPLVHALAKAGADRGALVTFLTAWSLTGFNRLLVWELPIMGAGFAGLRFVASLPLAIPAGLLARRLARRRFGRGGGNPTLG